jgi:hypothetical protein
MTLADFISKVMWGTLIIRLGQAGLIFYNVILQQIELWDGNSGDERNMMRCFELGVRIVLRVILHGLTLLMFQISNEIDNRYFA